MRERAHATRLPFAGLLAAGLLGLAALGALLLPGPASSPPGRPLSAGGGALITTPEPAGERTIGPHGDGLPRASEPPTGRWTLLTIAPRPPAELTGYRWPLDRSRITNAFGVGRPGNFVLDGQTLHDGIDLSTFCGDRIEAAHDGVVLVTGRHYEGFVGWVGDLGPFRARLDARGWSGQAIAVVIDDGNGYRSMYFHLGRTAVKAGDVVRAGDLIGYEGSTGNSTGCHLHYGLFSPLERRTFALDPEVAARKELPPREIARIDPMLVMPPIEEAGIVWGWGAGGP